MSTKGLPSSQLIEAIRAGSLHAVLAALDDGADVNEADIHGYAGLPLRTACFLGNLPIIRELLSHGADVNARTADGVGAPLRLALRAGHRDVLAVLVSQGAEVPDDVEIPAAAPEQPFVAPADAAASQPRNFPDLDFNLGELSPPSPAAASEAPEAEIENMIDFVSSLPKEMIEEVDVKGVAYGADTNILALDFERSGGAWEKVPPADKNDKS